MKPAPDVLIDEHRLGQYLVRMGKVQPAAIQHALEVQADLPFLRLGEILLGWRAIEFRDLVDALHSQFAEAMLGEVLQRRGRLDRDQLAAALDAQRAEGGLLGEVLVRQGVITSAELDQAIAEQGLYREYKVALGTRHGVLKLPELLRVETRPHAPAPGWSFDLEAALAPAPWPAQDGTPWT